MIESIFLFFLFDDYTFLKLYKTVYMCRLLDSDVSSISCISSGGFEGVWGNTRKRGK